MKEWFFSKEKIKEMKEECPRSIFLPEEYDDAIEGYCGMSDAIVYDIKWLAQHQVSVMNYRDYDIRVAMNGGARYYEFQDGIKYWKRRFDDFNRFKKLGVYGDKIPPTYYMDLDKDGNELPYYEEE